MPTNRGQGQSTRWYQLCFVPSNADSSDDSDTESVVIPHTTPTDTWQENIPQESPSPSSPPRQNVEPEIDWRFPPPPPPPPRWENPELEVDSSSLSRPRRRRPPSWESLELEIRLPFLLQPPRPPPPPPPPPPPRWENPELEVDSSSLSRLRRRRPPSWESLEREIRLPFLLQPPPPPPPPLPRWENLELEIDSSSLSPPRLPPRQSLELEIDSPFLSPQPSPPPRNPEPEIDLPFLSPLRPPPPPPMSPDHETRWASYFLLPFDIESQHNTTTDQPHTPDSIMSEMCKVKISELKESYCPICMEDFKVGYKACRLPCNHTFYSECIFRWLNNNKTCPVCRFRLDGWEEAQGSYLIDNDDGNDNLDTEFEIPRPVNIQNASDLFFPPLPEGVNSDYDSACDELGDSPEDRDIVGASQSG